MICKFLAKRRAARAVRTAVAYNTLPMAFWCPLQQSRFDYAATKALAKAARYA